MLADLVFFRFPILLLVQQMEKKGETADSLMGPSDTEGSSRENSDWKSSSVSCGAMKRCGMDTTSKPSPNSGLSSASLSPNRADTAEKKSGVTHGTIFECSMILVH